MRDLRSEASEPRRSSMDATPRPRVEHIGSLGPPPALLNAAAAYTSGDLGDDELREIEDSSIRDVVAEQEKRGLPLLTDGELRRVAGRDALAQRIATVTRFGHTPRRQLPAGDHAADAGPLGRSRPMGRADDAAPGEPASGENALLDEHRFLTSLTTQPVKVALLGPDYVLQTLLGAPEAADHDSFHDRFQAVVDFEHELLQEVIDAGCAYIQLDSPGYVAYADPGCLAEMRGRGIDPVADLEWAIEADNAVARDLHGALVGLHMCRGHDRERSLAQMPPAYAEILFDQLTHQRLLIDCDTRRPRALDALRFLPAGREVVLGIVDSHSAEIETVDAILLLVEQASRWVPVDKLALSPTCGFASAVASGVISVDQQWRKLDVLVEAAGRIWV